MNHSRTVTEHGTEHGIEQEPTATRAWLAARVAEHLRMSPADLSPDTPLSEYGLDSVYALSVAADLEDRLGVTVDPTVLWDNPTLNALCTAVERPAPTAPAPTGPTSPDPVAGTAQPDPATEATQSDPATEATQSDPATEATQSDPATETTRQGPAGPTGQAGPAGAAIAVGLARPGLVDDADPAAGPAPSLADARAAVR
ncbi:phosphopantetheine-binding protein [Streptomyces zaomyceticus]|uniref:Phosphopantetheine-binding protein n=1 Tax=Streptomyces zaomyceticus TaxID=68286 RepID=A0ABZ1L8I7_9ACTN